MGTVKVYRTYYLLDDVVDGDYPHDDVYVEIYENFSPREAAELIVSLGLTFAASGNDWAADPDGSYVTNYAAGEQCETSAHLVDFHPRLVDAIIRRVG